ncbi:hypothetical protein DCC85_09465 [Paenibacillus sp. CAA11]|uniref:type III-B CRISPR module-associated protein Cmr5 n=1 Tax=Paenibacillus sp. CAA11 TaxID=1532905 RepID=UPI000D33AF92|nr:type III-B CRISPR module-associated protein Cmr5 [Paenibacillus sp. CAA11]AWB44434.1 hypothetical protein DCC85_09465 [Paenibacillus sp. CAA11]
MKAVEWDITKPLISDQNNDYLFLSQKVLRASVWFKRYAEAILQVQQGIEIEETSMDSEIVEDKR